MVIGMLFATIPVKTAHAASSSESESNNTAATANTISVNTTISGNLSSSSDVDWFKFTVSNDGYIYIDFKHDILSSTNTYWEFEIFQSDGVTHYDNCYSAWSVKGNENLSTNKLGIGAGTYYLRVDAYSYSSATYSITLTEEHDHVGIWEVSSPAGCSTTGTESRTFTICGKVEDREIAALGHTNDNGKVLKETTIFQKGETEFICTVCGRRKLLLIRAKFGFCL